MNPPRRLPTGLLVLLAAAVLVTGGVWWVRAAPKGTATTAPNTDTVLIQLEDGAVLSYSGPTGDLTPGLRDLQQIITTEWPCRPDQTGGLAPNMMDNQGLDLVPQEGVQVMRLPRCSVGSRTGR